jgi:hypothetical protein
MANDKDFVVNGPVVVGKDTKVTVGTIASGAVDLSTGNYFTDSPSGDYTYTFANPAAVQSFQIEATGGSDAVAETFSTTLYTGTGATNSINNGLDLAGDGGLVWIKKRNSATNSDHMLFDTERGVNNRLRSNTTDQAYAVTQQLNSFNSNGFTLGTDSPAAPNVSGDDYASWSFKEQTKFFDVIKYSGDSNATRSISHGLGSSVGMIMIKTLNANDNWLVYHRGLPNGLGTGRLKLNLTNAVDGTTNFLSADSSSVTFASNAGGNYSGNEYVMYLFAHDTASDGLIQCGSYTGNGSTTGPEINLGWQPQWVLVKESSNTGNWQLFDNMRGMVADGADARIAPNLSNAEDSIQSLTPTATGFKINTTSGNMNTNNSDHIYMAIRSAAAPAITWPSSIEWTAGSTPKTPAEGETDVYTFTTDDGGTTYTGIQSIDNAS